MDVNGARSDNRSDPSSRSVQVFRAGSSDRWTWSMDIERSVDFCVYALRRDGLHVAPFDQHPEG